MYARSSHTSWRLSTHSDIGHDDHVDDANDDVDCSDEDDDDDDDDDGTS